MISEAQANPGQDQNVDLRMPEHPEEMLPQHRVAARLRVEEVRAQKAIEQQHDLRGRQRRHGDQNLAGDHEAASTPSRASATSVIPFARMLRTVAMTLMAVMVLPMPLNMMLRTQ